MKSATFIVEGEPTPKGRPRVRVVNGKFAQVYTDAKTREYEKKVGEEYKVQVGYKFDCPVSVHITCVHGVPKSATKKRKQDMLDGLEYPVKNDIDNCFKACADGLQGIAYDNDSQIVKMSGEKRYGENAHVLIKISEVCL